MKNITTYIGLCAAGMIAPMAQSQTAIDFETENYTALGVYDTWEFSPFRTGQLQGNVAVVDNHLSDSETNSSAKMLGIQRSRFGSNTFGARIDLTAPFTIESGATYYAHVMIHKPNEGRVMLIGLGKRGDRENQSNEVEQFWSYPVNEIKTGEWFDAVFPVKCNGGVEIHSLVLVPDCEAPHNLTEDFVAYIDEILINDQLEPRFGLGDYPVNFSPDAAWGRSDRKISAVNLNGGSDGNQSISIPDGKLMGYNVMFDTPFKAKPGSTVTANFSYVGEWMHGYVYLDKGNDGNFSYGTDDNNYLDTTTDLVSYSLYRKQSSGNGRNSAGTTIYEYSNGFNTMTMPSFTIPSDMAPGIYRLRYKVDWNNIDPGGNIDATNNILSNGGGVVDVLLNIHGDEITVNQDNRNGEILIASTGETIKGDKMPFGQSLKIKMNPSNGFSYNGIRVRHGYNLTGDSIVKSNPQYRDEFFYLDEFDSNDDTFTIPARVMDGDVLIEGLFVESGTTIVRKKVTYNIMFNGDVIDTQEFEVMSGTEYPEPAIESEASPSYYSLTGYPEGVTTDEDETINLTLIQTLPFEVSTDHNSAYWYNMTLTAEKNYLTHTPGMGYISLGATTTTKPSATDYNSQWAFVGNIFTGFQIINRGAGEGTILSSSHNTTANTGGNTYPIMTAVPVPDTHNTYWIPTVGTASVGINGFYLHQLGHTDNRMNSRDSRLAYWTGGAGDGSTFLVTHVATSAIDDIATDNMEYPAKYYNLQGVRINPENMEPGIYICRKGSNATKVLVK